MSFNLELNFSGIAAFIPTDDYDYPIAVVMPGLDREKTSLDDEELCPHNSYLDWTGRKRALKGRFVTLEVDYEQSPGYLPPQLPKELINLGITLKELCVLDPGLLKYTSPPRPELVMTRILLPAGAEYTAPQNNPGWKVDPLGNGHAVEGAIAHTVSVRYTGLTSATACLEAMDDSVEPEELPLIPDDGTEVIVNFTNTCKELPSSPKHRKGLRDRDFKWYYELLSHEAKDKIAEIIDRDSRDLPIPRRMNPMNQSIMTVAIFDCYPGQMGNYTSAQVPLQRSKRPRD